MYHRHKFILLFEFKIVIISENFHLTMLQIVRNSLVLERTFKKMDIIL